MSSIPTSAMPHATPSQDGGGEQGGGTEGGGRASIASRAATLVRDNPKTVIAAGAAVAAGVAAAAAIPLVRSGRGRSGGKAKGGKTKG